MMKRLCPLGGTPYCQRQELHYAWRRLRRALVAAGMATLGMALDAMERAP